MAARQSLPGAAMVEKVAVSASTTVIRQSFVPEGIHESKAEPLFI